MGVSIIQIQRDLILNAIKKSPAGRASGGWKVLVVDEDSRKLIDNVVREDDILELRVTNIDQLEQRRQKSGDTDALYILSPQPHIVDCLLADLESRRYGAFYILWTAILSPTLRERLTRSRSAQDLQISYQVMNVDFHPRESHLVTLRDPYSFPVLYHPACSGLVKQHLSEVAQRIASVCIALQEYPTVRYYRPTMPTHEAAVLSEHLARAVQNELDSYAHWNPEFAQPANRPKAALYVMDRSMDLMAPLLHEFTYQAMAHDLLPIKERDKVTFRTTVNEGQPNEEVKDLEISDKDKVWVDYRHLHMRDTIEKLMADFQKFLAANPHFANADQDTTNVNAIKDMLAGLPQFQEMKEAYSLHLTMAQDCMNIFQEHKLPDIAGAEQTMATGLDEDGRKPKNLPDSLVRLLDDEAVVPQDRLRLIALYVIAKYGILRADIAKLLLHAQLPLQDEDNLINLELLGARVTKPLKDKTEPPAPILPKKTVPTTPNEEEISISRFKPVLKSVLDEHITGTLDATTFPFLDPAAAPQPNDPANISSASLRSAKPTWAKSKLGSVEPRQRIIVVMAGGATYSEARTCYEASEQTSRDVVLVTSHMLTPGLFIRQVADLSADRRQLALPQDKPARRAPAHLFEEDKPKSAPMAAGSSSSASGLPSGPGGGRAPGPRPMGGSSGMPTDKMGRMNLNGSGSNGSSRTSGDPSRLRKDKDYDQEKKKKKGLFGRT